MAVVTRFAPSPTGYLHIGGARTALFNWLWARRMGGVFILRIEDTDTKRNTPTATQQVINDLKWLGVNWDEGPEVGGPNGPYNQSERLDIYNKYLGQLLDEGKAYYCFDTPEELSAMRAKLEKEKRGFIYRAPETLPTQADVEKAKEQGKPITVRFKMPTEGEIVINDIVRGQVKFATAELGDFIIQKSDGFPTYHFACVVDDELMGVTHVCRGQEHLMNTPYHQALQNALGFKTPEYAHMSVTVSEGGGKLSKRERPKALHRKIKELNLNEEQLEELADKANISQNEMTHFIQRKVSPDMPAIDAMAEFFEIHLPEINVVDFFKSGYLPETMVNFTALLGWNPGGDIEEIMTVDEIVKSFDLGRLSKSNSLFDRAKLMSFNIEHIRRVSEDKLLSHFEHYLKVVDSPVLKADDETLLKLLEVCQGARTLEDIEKKCRFLFIDFDEIEFDEKAVKKVLLKNDGEGLLMLKELKGLLSSMEAVTEYELEKLLRGLAEEKGVGLGKVAQPLRVAISGTTVSPPIFVSIELLTMGKTIERIEKTLSKF